jgi:hypothetical protein
LIEQHAPWGTKWFGKGAADGAYFHNFRIPFGSKIRITAQSTNVTNGGFYFIVRGKALYKGKMTVFFFFFFFFKCTFLALGVPSQSINIGGIELPITARMRLRVFHKTVEPLEWIPLVDEPKGNGLFFMQTLAVKSGNLNFLEGCYHAYTPYNTAFPGVVLSTGTEDYFDSAW